MWSVLSSLPQCADCSGVVCQVNGVQMTGKSQGEAVAVLRTIAANSVAALIVSRQVTDDTEVLALPDAVSVVPLHSSFTGFFQVFAQPSLVSVCSFIMRNLFFIAGFGYCLVTEEP